MATTLIVLASLEKKKNTKIFLNSGIFITQDIRNQMGVEKDMEFIG